MIEVFQMSDEEGFPDSSTNSIVSNVTKESVCNFSKSSSSMEQMNPVQSSFASDRKRRVRRRHRPPSFSTCFTDYYSFTDEILGMGAHGVVCTCVQKLTNIEYAVKLINKQLHPDRQRVFKEMDIFYACRNCEYILKLHEYFEDEMYFYLLFDKMHGGQLLHHILNRGHLNEREASMVTRQIAEALQFMHGKGLAHRDLKPENILCQSDTELLPIKLCDFDLASAIRHAGVSTMTTPALSTPVGSAEFMAPEVVDAWVLERDKGDLVNYDKRCDLWSLGVIVYIMLCGYPPFYGRCEESRCGWEDGRYCKECQQLLFNRIRDGEFSFPSPEWDCISDDAKDLIGHLLVCDSRFRYSADEVLQHRWIKYPAPETALTTASVLLRDNSVRNLETFANEALSISKLIDVHLATNSHQNVSEMSINKKIKCEFMFSSDELMMPSSETCANVTIANRSFTPKSQTICNKPFSEKVKTPKALTFICNKANALKNNHIDEIPSSTGKMHFKDVGKDNCNNEEYKWNCMESVLVECMKSILLDKQKKKNNLKQHHWCNKIDSSHKYTSRAFSSGGSSCGFEYMKEMQTVENQPFARENLRIYDPTAQSNYDSICGNGDQLLFDQDPRTIR